MNRLFMQYPILFFLKYLRIFYIDKVDVWGKKRLSDVIT